MDNRDYMKAFGEWLCSIAPNPMVKSLTHASIKAMYERDYIIVTNLCDGFGTLSKIPLDTIDGAKERYKQFNKALLETTPLSEDKKKEVSAQIDANAERLKQRWISILQNKGINITDK